MAAGGAAVGAAHTVHVVIDHEALVRGQAEPSERCEIEGVGPVPVGVVRSLMDDAFLTAVVTDGVDVARVAHLGRHPTAHQRTALAVRDPECVVPGCHVRVGLEIDHVEPWSATRITKLDAPGPAVPVPPRPEDPRGLPAGGRSRALALAQARRQRGGAATTATAPTHPRRHRRRSADDGTGTIAERQARICDAAIARAQAMFGV